MFAALLEADMANSPEVLLRALVESLFARTLHEIGPNDCSCTLELVSGNVRPGRECHGKLVPLNVS